jgi:F-type H+-transporting ATPase subunit delta
MPVAQRMYARALLEAAQDRDRVDVVQEELGDFVESVREVPELRALLRDPQLDARAKVAALEEILGGADELVRNFLVLVAERGRAAELDEIHREFERLLAAETGRLTLELTTAVELSDGEADEIVAQIEQTSGRTVEATRKVDPALIGGVVLQVGDRRLDASVRGRIERLSRELATRT